MRLMPLMATDRRELPRLLLARRMWQRGMGA
jgi:hypothetical protein